MNSNALPPANLAALKGILGKSKALIDRDINKVPESRGMNEALPPRSQMEEMPAGMIDSGQLIEAHQLPNNAPVYQEKQVPQMQQPSQHSTEAFIYNDAMVDNSRLSPAIKEAMKSQNLSVAAPEPFTLDDISDFGDKPVRQQRVNEQREPQQQQQQMGGVNENQLRQIVRDELLTILSGEFTKNIRESTIKKTIQTLINEGKITTKKKRRIA